MLHLKHLGVSQGPFSLSFNKIWLLFPSEISVEVDV